MTDDTRRPSASPTERADATPCTPRTLCVVCPVYRERDSIAEFHRRLTAVTDSLRPRYTATILYVVDPSPDGTVEAVREVVAGATDTEAIVMSKRFGHQMAIVAGIDATDADALIMMDSDLQHPPELIPALVEQFEAGFDVVQTVRSATVGPRRGRTESCRARSTGC